MFTGLIEETGRVKSLIRADSNLQIQIKCKKILEDIKLGDSIAVNGVCLTVTDFDEESFSATAIDETLKLTNLNQIQEQQILNLERCLRLGDRLGGHLVQGHIEGIATVNEIIDHQGSYEYLLEVPAQLSRYIIHKGSITLNGISLTVASKNKNTISVAIIPETLSKTDVQTWALGSQINIETDLMAKYAESLLIRN